MILENGVIRTMDASLPVQRALAVAGSAWRARSARTRRPWPAPKWSIWAAAALSPASPIRTSISPPGRSRCVRCGWRESARWRRLSRVRSGCPTWRRVASCAASAGGTRSGRRRRRGGARHGHGERPDCALRARLSLALGQLGDACARGRRSRGAGRSRRAGRERRADGRPARGGGVAVPRGAPRRSRRRIRGRHAGGVARGCGARRDGGPRQGRLARRCPLLAATPGARGADAARLAVPAT